MITRWPIPASFASPRALTLYSPGQYSPGTSPTRASTPSDASAAAIVSAIAAKRVRVPAFAPGSRVAREKEIEPSWKTAARPPARRSIGS